MLKSLSSSTARDLAKLRSLVHAETGIKLPQGKDVMIETRLKRRLIDLNMPDMNAYLNLLFANGGLDAEFPKIVDLMTTNKTDFFREDSHFQILVSQILPSVLRALPAGASKRFKVWSAAASSGEEAWTISMLLAKAAQQDPRLEWAILGTDISNRVLERANRAVYTKSDLAPVPDGLRSKYVMMAKDQASGRIVPELRARVRFESLNLTKPPYAIDNGLDVVFLRNVLIYFEPEMQARVIAQCASHLRAGGYFFVGHSESMTVNQLNLTQIAPGVFRKEGAAL
ncbi:CheR family methyltransferase [Celeribacter marinus]|uniref:CheR family methyltransferase n=1 Tax=Celeribacter marinus TaxID=1397108 RepID=UPI003F6BC9B2